MPPRTLSQSYADLYDEMLTAVGKQHPDPAPLTSLWPMCGDKFDQKLMFIGRAVRGWRHGWNPADMTDPGKRSEAREKSRQLSEAPANPIERPMMWVIRKTGPSQRVDPKTGAKKREYNVNQSAFWRTIRDVYTRTALQGGKRSDDWPSYICWSNLYKISPKSGGNPSKELRKLQCRFATELIAEEIEQFAPARVLVMAGENWFRPFAERMKLTVKRQPGAIVSVAQCDERTWVIAPHPQGKKQKPLVDAIADAFARHP